MASAFTVKEREIRNALKSKATVHFSGKSLEVIALWDTGATSSCISEYLADNLNLVATGYIPIHTPSGTSTVKTYCVDVTLPNDVAIADLPVCSSKIGDQGIDLLIGMDIIGRGDFVVSNYHGQTAFSFRMPSEALMDFVTGIRMSNIIQANRTRPHRWRNKKKR